MSNNPMLHGDIDGSAKKIGGFTLSEIIPTGTVLTFAGNSTPKGFLFCDGSSVLRADYPDLFAVIGTTYGTADSDHFTLPNLNGRFVEGSDKAGTVKNAGLPNITGKVELGDFCWKNGLEITTQKCFSVYKNHTCLSWDIEKFSEGNNGSRGFELDASKSSSIYGKSDTVQPPSVTMRYIIKS